MTPMTSRRLRALRTTLAVRRSGRKARSTGRNTRGIGRKLACGNCCAGTGTVFVAAIVSNQARFYPLFEEILVLIVDPATLRNRLLNRTGNDFGKHPDELADILSYHAELERELLSVPGAVTIDATRPLELIVDEVIARTRPDVTLGPEAGHGPEQPRGALRRF